MNSPRTISSPCRQFVFSAVLAFFLLSVMAQALPLASSSPSADFEFPSALLIVRPWADAAQPAEWRGQWIRRLSPRVGHLGQLGLGGSSTVAVQKKWTRLEPSIRFY